MTRLTFDDANDNGPVWSPDDRQVAFASSREGVGQVYRKDASGAGQEELLTEGPNDKQPLDWVRDYLLYREQNPESNWDLFALPLVGERKPIPVVQTPFSDNVGRISPDGLWLAYKSEDSGQPEIYVKACPVPGENGRPGGKWQISNSGASDLSWRADGGELYYEALDGKVMAVDIRTSARGVTAGTPRELFSADIDTASLHSLQATGDGLKFLLFLNPQNAQDQRLTVVSGWQSKLRR
jgi:Tol biopolymer transport system component